MVLHLQTYQENFFLSFGIVDNSIIYSSPPEWFREPIVFETSNLPILMIDTYGNSIPDEPRIDAYLGIIDNETGLNHVTDDFNGYNGHITIEKEVILLSGMIKRHIVLRLSMKMEKIIMLVY